MPKAPVPLNEMARLAALRSYDVLDSIYEQNFDSITQLAARLCDCPIALISLIESEFQWFKANVGMEAQGTHRDVSFCAHAILHHDQPLIVHDATSDCRFADNDLVLGPPGIRFYAGIPLVTKAGLALGTLCVIDTKVRDITPVQLDALTVLAQSVVTALDLRLAMKAVSELALTDHLTGLPNRSAFLNAVSKSMARQKRDNDPFAVIYVDLDGMKQINDQLGHAKGDEVLVLAAGALAKSVRSEDNVCRLSGDEFAALLDVGTIDQVERICERFRASIERGMRAKGWRVTASIGAALFLKAPESEATALNTADALMYAAKASGKNQIVCRAINDVWAEGSALVAYR